MKAWHKALRLYIRITWIATIPWVMYLVFARGYPKAILICIPFYVLLAKDVYDEFKCSSGENKKAS